MKINKLFLTVCIAVIGLSFSSCSDDVTYTPGKPAGQYNVAFTNESSKVLDFDATEMTIDFVRANGSGALTVPVTILNKPDFVTIPTEVTFADGATTASITATIGEGMEPFTDYSITLSIPEEYTNPYAEETNLPNYQITFLKEDYATYATGTFHETVYYEDEWEVEIQYSPLLGIFRIPNAIIDGTHWYFKWNEAADDTQEFYFCDATGKKVTKFFSGINNKTYGAVTCEVKDEYFMGYDPDYNEFDFVLSYTVSAGSFGTNYEYIDNLEFVNQ